MKALIIGYAQDSIAAAQREPFIYNRRLIHRQVDLHIEHIKAETLLELGEACKKNDSDIIFLLPSWRTSPSEAERVIKKVREDHPKRKLIFIDPWAQTSSKHFNLLPYVDHFLKRQRYKNCEEYKRHFIGGSMLTDFIARQWQFDFEGWYVGSEIPEGYENRITSGWNLGTAQRFKQALRKPRFGFRRRPVKEIDIFCRLSLGQEHQKEWYYKYRIAALEALKPLEADYKVVASGGFAGSSLVPRRQYYKEIQSSRIVFSPFGWGENCWRDFEAICYNCLLVKPSMDHIDTQPNIFVEGETYIPVKWDFADLDEKCRYYLKHSDEAECIVQNARRVYEDYFAQGTFVNRIQELIIG